MSTGGAFYRHTGIALLRSAVTPLGAVPDAWPDLASENACRSWLKQVWSRPETAEAIGQASPALARQVAVIRSAGSGGPKDVRRATMAVSRYLLRGAGRPTPFGLFAGVAPVRLDQDAGGWWGTGHRPLARADTQWLADVTARLEAILGLLERLDVEFTNLAVRRGKWLEAPSGPGRVRLSRTAALDAVREAAAAPVRFGVLADKLAADFGAGPAAARVMLTELVRQGVLVSRLRAPFTITDPLGYLISHLRDAGAADLPEAEALLNELQTIRELIRQHNTHTVSGEIAANARADIVGSMRRISAAGRSPLAIDLRLDCEVRLPTHVAAEVERAATALLLLSGDPDGSPGWRAYHRAFAERYGTGTLVPVTEAVDPDVGLGYPPGYPGSVLPEPSEPSRQRDQRLLALAWQALSDGTGELVLTDQVLTEITGQEPGTGTVPPHVEVAARIHADSIRALDDGDYTAQVSPARACGVMTSRFTLTATGSGLEEVYRALPVTTAGALPVQMSFGAAYPHAENIIRVPAYLPHILSLGEHRASGAGQNGEAAIIGLDDLAITATAARLHLVSMSRHQVVEPLVFHALELGKQPPPLARFLARLTRGFSHGWTAFDWGPQAAELPHLPRVRYGRAILTPARWRITAGDLGQPGTDGQRQEAVAGWRRRWSCPATVELRDGDRTLRLDLDQPSHAPILRSHLARHGHAVLTEAPSPRDLGWIGGHAHEIVFPLVTTRPAAASPLAGPLPVVVNATAGQMPGAPDAKWLYARLHSHPDRHDEIIASHLPALASDLDGAAIWFVRYRTPEQTDHLRIRIRLPGPGQFGEYAAAAGRWAARLRACGLASKLVLDTYTPETGRYGTGPALEAAEAVFIADSSLVAAGLLHLRGGIDPVALAAVNMTSIAVGFLGTHAAASWLLAGPASTGTATGRAVADNAIDLATRIAFDSGAGGLDGWPGTVTAAWRARNTALDAYRQVQPASADLGVITESLLHMHHNRARGIDRDGEAACRRLARRAALAWQARRAGRSR